MLHLSRARIVERHGPAAAQAGLRHVRDRQREGGGHVRVDGVAPLRENGGAGGGRIGVRSGNHAAITLYPFAGHR